VIDVNEKELRNSISSFSGNIQAMFSLTQDLRKHLDFDLDINFDSTNSLQRFTNIVRNMISRGVISKPLKSGRTLIFDEASYLQLLTARKYLVSGCSFDSLEGYLVGLSTDEIYDRLFAAQLPDIDKLTKRSLAASIRNRSEPSSEPSSFGPNLYHHIKVGTGLILLAQQERYTEDEIFDLVDMLKKYVSERPSRNNEMFNDDNSDQLG